MKHFPSFAKFRNLFVLLLLCGYISPHTGPVSLGVTNCYSVRNKDPSISGVMSTSSFDLLLIKYTHIRVSDTDSLLRSVSSLGYITFVTDLTLFGDGV